MAKTKTATSPVRILPEYEDLAVPIEQPIPWPGNPRRGDDITLRDSLTEHGQYAPILVQASTGQVIKGNNTLRIMRELGATRIAVRTVDVDDDRALRIATIDNKSTDDATYDQAELAAMLDGLDDLVGTGWTPDEIDDILAELETQGAPVAEIAPALAPPVYPTPPASDAAYAEDPEQEQARFDTQAAKPPRSAQGLTEMILVMPEEDRQEAVRTITDIKTWLDPDLKNAQVVLRALRTLAAVADARHDPDRTVNIGQLLAAAGHTGGADDQP